MRHQKMAIVAISILALSSVGCSIQMESIMEMQEGSAMVLTVDAFPPQVLELEGGTIMGIDISIGLFDLLFGSFEGDVDIVELLFATPPFDFLGIPIFNTEELCVVTDEANPGSGTFAANLWRGEATFDVAINTIALIGNEALAAVLPGGGFAFPFDLQSTIPMSLGDMLGMLTGSGNLSVTQELDQDLTLTVDPDGPGGADPIVFPGHVGGSISLNSADAFPSTPLLTDCIAFLAE